MEPDYLVPKLSAMFFAPLPLQMHLLLQPFVPESALGVDGARQAPPLPCLSDKAAAFLGFHIACVGANHPSALRGSEDSLKNPWCCCAVCSVRSRQRVKMGALGLRSPLPANLPQDLAQPCRSPQRPVSHCWVVSGRSPTLPKARPLFLSQHKTPARPRRTTQGSFKH